MAVFPGQLLRRLARRAFLDHKEIQRRHQPGPVRPGLAMHQRRKLGFGEQLAGGVKHRLVRRGAGPRGEIEKRDPGGGTGLGLELPAAIIARSAQVDDSANTHLGGRQNAAGTRLVRSPHARRDLVKIMPPDAKEAVILEDQFRPVAQAAALAGRGSEAHEPATIMPSMRSDGAAVLRRMSISLARVTALNMSFRLPAMVASDTAWVTFPLLIQNPPAPRL